MGRYRELVRALVYYSNSSNRGVIERRRGGEGNLTQHEYQVLEYICEFESENRIMSHISRDLGIAQSNITKAAKTLLEKGCAERFRLGGNRKNVVLKPTPAGKELYKKMSSEQISPAFLTFFHLLDGLTQEQLEVFENAVRSLSSDWAAVGAPEEPVLTKID